MGPPVYVEHLIDLLKRCGLDQNTIASRLGTNRTTVSFWATGQRPLGKRHVAAFLRLVEETIRFAPETRRDELFICVRAWRQELHVRLGDCQREIQRQLSVLQSPLAQQNPLSLTRAERQRMADAAKALAEQLQLIDTIDPSAESFNVLYDRIEFGKPTPNSDPLVELALVAATYNITTEEEGTGEVL
jgi:transcriptional regulator with XRE-family HTH domain